MAKYNHFSVAVMAAAFCTANNVFFRQARVGFFVHKLGPSETCQDPGLGTGFPTKKVRGKLKDLPSTGIRNKKI